MGGSEMKNLFAVRQDTQTMNVILFIIRVITGYAFILHGWGKIQNPMNWMQGSSVPGIFQALAAVAEFFGGFALIFGLFTALASLGIFFTMIVAAFYHAVLRGDPFVAKGGPSYELAVSYLMISLILMVTGAGKFSADYKLFGSKEA